MENQALVNDEGIKEQFFSLDDAAQQLGVSRKGLDTYLNNHPELKEKYLTKAKLDGRRRYVLDVRALPFINLTRGANSKNLQVEGISKFKEDVANKAIEELTLENRIKLLEDKLAMYERKSQFLALPVSEEKPPELSYRSLITQRINAFAKESGIDYSTVRGKLYYDFSYRHNVNIRNRAKKTGISQIDVIAEMGMLKEAWIIACSSLKLKGE